MNTLLKIFILVAVLYFAAGNGDIVTKDEFNELKQIVGSLQKLYMNEITKINLLRKKCNDLEGKLNHVLADLKSTKSRLSKWEHKMELSELYNQPITTKGKRQNDYLERYDQGPVGPERNDAITIKDSSKTDRQIKKTLKHQNKTTMVMEDNNSSNRLIKRLNPVSSLSNRVAFSAWNVVDLKNLGYHQPIVFKSVLINVGNSYHQTTGIFSPIIPGVYVFYYSIIVAPNVGLNTALVKDGTEISYSYANGASSKYSQDGNMAIVHLNVGDNVWVRIETPHPPASDDIGSIENSFSGFLLFSDNSQ